MAKKETPSDRIRLTISVTPEVHAVFTRMAEAGSMSVSRAMGDWLADTLDAAEYTAGLMEKARAAPKTVARELHAYALGLADETSALITKLVEGGAAPAQGARRAADRATAQPLTPPVSNTGGKVPAKRAKRAGGKAK